MLVRIRDLLVVEKIRRLGTVARATCMFVGEFRRHAAAWCALDEAALYEVRLVDILDGSGILANGCGDGGNAYWTTIEFINYGEKNLEIHLIETEAVDIEGVEALCCNLLVDVTIANDLSKIANSTEKRISNTWRTATAKGYGIAGILIYSDPKDACGATHNLRYERSVVIFEVALDAETGTQRTGKQTTTRGGTHKGEGIEVYLDCTRARTLVNYDIDLEILHCGVEIFLDDRAKAVNLIDEENIVRLKGREETRKVARLVDDGAGRCLHIYAQLVGNDVGESGLAEAWWAIEEGMVERLAAHLGGSDEDAEIGHHATLPREIVEGKRAEFFIQLLIGSILLSDVYAVQSCWKCLIYKNMREVVLHIH